MKEEIFQHIKISYIRLSGMIKIARINVFSCRRGPIFFTSKKIGKRRTLSARRIFMATMKTVNLLLPPRKVVGFTSEIFFRCAAYAENVEIRITAAYAAE